MHTQFISSLIFGAIILFVIAIIVSYYLDFKSKRFSLKDVIELLTVVMFLAFSTIVKKQFTHIAYL